MDDMMENPTVKAMVMPLVTAWLRHAISGWGVWLIHAGLLDKNQESQFEGGVMVLSMLAWTAWDKYGRAALKAQLAKLRSHVAAIPVAPPGAPSAVIATNAAVVAAKVAAGALLLGLFLVGTGHAAPKLPQITGDIVADTKANLGGGSRAGIATGDPLAQLQAQIESVRAEVVTGLVQALTEADADAGALTNPTDPTSFKDPISHACYPAQIKFIQSLPNATPITSPAPYNLVVLFQRKRDFLAQIQSGLPPYLKLGCSALIGDEIKIFIQTMAMAGVKIGLGGLTGLFPAAAPITLPALSILP